MLGFEVVGWQRETPLETSITRLLSREVVVLANVNRSRFRGGGGGGGWNGNHPRKRAFVCCFEDLYL